MGNILISKGQIRTSDFIAFTMLKIGPVNISPGKIITPYKLLRTSGEEFSTELIYKYEENVFIPDDPASINLASMISAQVALNYGLFCRKIIFDGLFDETDRRFIREMMENTSREILVNKLLMPNPFIKPEYKGLQPEKRKRFTSAEIIFVNTAFPDHTQHWELWTMDKKHHCILSSGGKDSLLTYGILKELHQEVHPVFINESGRHWFTALNAYHYLNNSDTNIARVWSNCDRIYNWMLRHMPFVRQDFQDIRSDEYPIRLWTVAVFLFGALPLAKKKKLGRILIGNEYDCTNRLNYQGITHYNGLYDQSRYFDNALSRYFLKKGWSISQFSILRSLSELLIIKILASRYPDLQRHQISCHAAHKEHDRIIPCGKCEKCRRIVGMLIAIGANPVHCGYTSEQIKNILIQIPRRKVHQLGADASHLYYLLIKSEAIQADKEFRKLIRMHPPTEMLRFDHERSRLMDIPADLRRPVIRIFLEHAGGAVKMSSKKWIPFNVLDSNDILDSYPFEPLYGFTATDSGEENEQTKFLWATMSWPSLRERLKIVDTAILPCGSIEQHGPHLPVDTDIFDADLLARKVAEACSDPKPFVLPSVSYGVSYHHEDFPGTLSISNEGLSKFIYDLGMSLAKNGIKKLVILNGHGDNGPTLNFAAQMINRDANIFVCVESGESSDTDIHKVVDTANDIHAGEIETSTSLASRPHLVDMDRAEDASIDFASQYLNFTSSRGVPWYIRTKKISESGVLGNPTRATREKGLKIWDIMVAHLVRFIEELKKSSLDEIFQKKY